jgi:phospholipase C
MRHNSSALLAPALVCIALAMLSTACGGGGSTTIKVPPPVGYSLAAATFSPSTVSAGSSPTSSITLTASGGYTGTVALSCTVTGAATPAPMCAVNPNSVSVTATGTATLTVSTATNNPSGAYNVSVIGKDASNVAPSNGPQSLPLTLQFQHIVVIVQENRTPDNMFQDPVLYMPPPAGHGADIAQQGVASTGTITLQPTSLGIDYDLSHEHQAFTTMCDYNSSTATCAMDHADLISPITCEKGSTNCPPTSPPPEFYYVQQSDVQPYWDMAEQFTFGDRMFQTNEGPSFPAHQILISGTSEPSTDSNLFVAENPLGVSNSSANTGCTAPAAEYVYTIDPTGTESTTGIYPCFEHPTLTDEMESAGVTWRYYAPLAGSIWTAPNAIEHMCAPPQSAACTAPDWANVALAPGGVGNPPILTDIQNNQLQQISWVIPTGSNSDHAGDTTTTGGPSWVASIVDAIAANPLYWPNTAIIIVWDDWGGWYDHVPPPKVINDGTSWGSGYVYGFRVPLIVVSPLAKPKYISHTVHDFGSILNFMEQAFNLPQLGFADSNTTDNLADCFDFTQTPIAPPNINSKLKADYFIHEKTPATGPDND